ncbi:synemin [Hyperolius riggenbachi]|uniref:synemin n=1 Tax=Hyperolius riggenbachi TaxID=752182 RepID=UPI0035A378EF
MLFVRREIGDEKAQLNELNQRLDLYLSRVRQLERENQQLVEEVQRARSEREVQWTQVYHPEMCELRRKVEDLNIQKCEAELQRDNLLHELQELQELWEQVKNMRLKIDQQLKQYKQDLQQAQKSQAALEQLYIQLQQECQMLQGSHEEELQALRDQALQTPLHITMQEVSRPRLSLTEIESFSLELSDSWKDAFVYYQKKIEELEIIVRQSEEDRRGGEGESNVYRLQVEKLCREYEDLLNTRNMLEDELLRMKEKYCREAEEYEIIIEDLENEKKTIAMTITERLRDFHDLTQVKTGLSLEVAAYRALLEAESRKGTVIVTEHNIRDRPPGYVNTVFEETTRFYDGGKERIQYPVTHIKDEMIWSAHTPNADRFLNRTVPQAVIKPRYTNLGNTSSSYVSRVYEEKGNRWDSLPFTTSYRSSYKPETKSSVSFQTVQPATLSPYASTQSTRISQTTKQEQIKDLKPVARPRTHSREARKREVDVKAENKQQKLDSHTETKIAGDKKIHVQSAEEERLEKMNKETVSVTEVAQKEVVQEPKEQELPVKKERKKREQAKKRKEERQSMVVGDDNVTGRSKEEVHETTQASVVGETTQDEQVVLEIPIRFTGRKQEDVQQKDNTVENKTARNVSQSYVSPKTVQEYGEDRALVDDLLRQLGQPSSFERKDTNISSEEKNQGSTYMRTFVLGENVPDKTVIEIPIQLEVSRKESISKKENVEKQSRVPVNVIQMKIYEESIPGSEEVDRTKTDSEINKFSRTDDSASVSSESIENRAFVSDILRELGQPSDLDDTNVTYVERKEKCSDGSTKTEIIVQSKTEEELDLFDEPDLTDLWNTTPQSSAQSSAQDSSKAHISEEIHSKKIKKTVLEDISGEEAEEWIGNVIRTGLKGSPGKSVNVEIVEESIGTYGYEKGEFCTPFHVEEADDAYTKEESLKTEKQHVSTKTDKIQDNIQPSAVPAHVEEITEGGHIDEEINYFVSIPDDNPYFEEEEEETIRGQIHMEEESQVKYSWQDEFLQGSQGRKSLSEMLKQASAGEQSSGTYKSSVDSTNTEDTGHTERSHVGTIGTEKTPTYDFSVKRSDELEEKQENRDSQFEIVIDKSAGYNYLVDSNDSLGKKQCIGESNVETIKIDKVVTYGSSVDGDEFDSEEQKGESHVQTVVIEKKINVPHEIQSSLMNLLSEGIKDPQQQLKGALECLKGNLPQELFKELSTIAGEEQTQTSNLAVDIKKVGQTEDSGMVTIVAEISSSQTLDADDIDHLELKESVLSTERTINKSQLKSTEDIISVLQKEKDISAFINEAAGSQGSYHSVLEMKNKGDYYTAEGIHEESQLPTSVHFSPTQEMSFGHISTDASQFIKRIELDTSEQILPEESMDDFSPTEINRSEHHIRLGPRETFSNKQIIFEGPISETFKLDIVKNTEDSSEQNRSIRHIKLSPTENVPAEQIIFQGPIFRAGGRGTNVTEELSVQEKLADSGIESGQSFSFETFQSGNKETTNQSNEFFIDTGKAVSHFKVNPGETFSKPIVFEGSIPRTYDINRTITVETDNSEDNNRPIEHSSPTSKIQVTKQIKYQGFVSEVEDYGNANDQNNQSNVNTSVHHIKLSPNKEQIVFQGPVSANVQITGEGNTYVDDTNRSIQHIRLGSSEIHQPEHVTITGPTMESYESSDFVVSSPSGDSTESERSFKHIKLGPKEKAFTFQMDITKLASKHTEESGGQESGMVITSSKSEGHPDFSPPSITLTDDTEVSESGYGEEEIAGVSQFAYETLPHSQNISETSDLEKTVQMQRIVHQSHVVSGDRKVAVVYLDEEEEEEEEDQDQDYLRRSF